MSVVYRDREQSRFDDSKSAVSARSGGTKVTRYIVKEDDSKTDYGRASRAEPRRSNYDDSRSNYVSSRFDDSRTNYDRTDSRVDETRTIRISRNDEEPSREYSRSYSTAEPKITRETITIRRGEDDRRDDYWNRPSGEDTEERELVIRRDTERDGHRDTRASVALSRVDDRRDTQVVSRVDDRRESRYDDYEVVSPQRGSFDDREVSRYIRTSEHYYPQQQSQPQTIIIRQEPIIIRERDRPREEEFQIVKKSEVDEERSVSRRSERPEPRDEEYFYEKRVRERIPEEDRRSRLRREVSPGDSISQVGRGRHSRRGSESDDSMVYVRKEKITTTDSRSSSGHRNRDLAAGALAGVGAAELIRNHKQKEGKETSTGVGRVARDAGAGILGAVAAEGIRRYRSKSRNRSRSRSSSGGRRRERSRSRRRRSRSSSSSSDKGRFGNMGGIGGLGLAAAAVAAGAFLASKNKKEASPDGNRRSRSRRRSSSRGRSVSSSRLSELENDPNANDARNPKHRNSRTAAAGAIGAAAAALLEHQRSKSRGRSGDGSPNRIKQGIPVVATGLGAAALAHLYEKNKAKSEAEEIVRDDRRRSRSRGGRSRSRGRGSSVYEDAPRQAAFSDPSLVQYGNKPLYGNNYGEGYYGTGARSAEPDYYNNSNRAMVPAPVPPPAASSFDATSTSRRPRSISSSRSRSRSRGAAAAGAAAGAGVAASAYDQNRKGGKQHRKHSRRRSSRQDSRQDSFDPRASIDPYNGRDPYEDANWHATHSASYAQGINDPYGSQAGFYPPPPGPMPQQGHMPQQSYTPQPAYAPSPAPQGNSYGPQDFPPPPPGAPQAQQPQFNPYAPNQNPYAPRSRGADDNVSAGNPASTPTDQHHSTADGLKHERVISPPIVGPEVTIQRPSVSTPVQQPRNSFPGSTDNPFAKPSHLDHSNPGQARGVTSGAASPGYQGTPLSEMASTPPARTLSRAAQTYTPVDRSSPQLAQDIRSTQSTPIQRDIPTVTDQPTPLPNIPNSGHPLRNVSTISDSPIPLSESPSWSDSETRIPHVNTSVPADVQRPIPRSVPESRQYAEPKNITPSDHRMSPEPMRIPQTAPQPRKPEMTQNSSNSGFATPFMPSPDIRPPSDDSLPQRPYPQMRGYSDQLDNSPSMPNLFIPSPSDSKTTVPAPEERAPRPRSPSASGVATPRRPSPTPENSHKRSVSFNPRLDFNEAPKGRDRHDTDSEAEGAEATRRRRSDRDRERDRERNRDRDNDGHHRSHRDRDRRGYDAGDDFSDDTPFEDHRRRSHDRGDRDRDRDQDRARRSSRRERADTQSLDREQDRGGHDKPKRSNTMEGSGRSHRRHRDESPGSDATEDLPSRFDERGRQKPGSYGGQRSDRTPDQDLLANSLDQILGGLFGKSSKR